MSTLKDQTSKLMQNSNHVNALLELGLSIEFSNFYRLAKLERKAHRAAENYCSIPNYNYDSAHDGIMSRVAILFKGKIPEGFFINGDPRGFALKIKPDHVPDGMHKDWGGYGILMPIDNE